MKLSTMRNDGTVEREMEVDQGTMTLQSASNDVIQEDDWSEYMDDFIYGPVQKNSDGLVYRMCIEVMDWWEATGEGVTRYRIDVQNMAGFEDLDDQEFDTEELAVAALEERKKKIMDGYMVFEDDADAEEAKEDCSRVSSSNVTDIEVPTYMVSLYVVPVSVPLDLISEIHGCGDELTEQMKESFEEDGDFRAYAWDISSYGHHVPIAMEQDGQVGFGVKCTDADLEAVLKKHKETAYAVMQMFGLYMDRPWNAVGWDGWHVLKEAKAFPGQHQTYNGELVETDEDGEPIQCNDCGQEKPCKKLRTTYCSADNDGEWICESCCESWYVCPDCGILVPIEPQGWHGVEWVKIHHEHYCQDCASKVYNGPDCPNTVAGGTEMEVEDVTAYSQNLSVVELDRATWGYMPKDGRDEHWWEVGMNSHHFDQEYVAKRIAGIVKAGKPTEEFIFGPFEHAQFGSTIGIYSRQKPRIQTRDDEELLMDAQDMLQEMKEARGEED